MRKPLATYRLQLHSAFGFDAAGAIADYLSALGVSHVYSSPYLQAMPGSMHGYDVADHHRVNMELGGVEAHERFCLRLGSQHLGQVLDIVPNHMAIGGRWNTWWWDVLENGVASPYAAYFDIDWQSPEERLRNKVLLPILGDHYGRVLKRGEIRIERSGAQFTAHYFDHELPVAPESLAPMLQNAAGAVGEDALGFLADSLGRLPRAESAEHDVLVARNRDKEVIRRWFERLLAENEAAARAVDAQLAKINADDEALHAVLDAQNYRVAYWKAASRDLGYRRFFDINTLVGLRMEDRRVFDDTHSLVLEWLRRGVLDGVRVDHPDGLRDPRKYFCRLRAAAPDVWIVAEKILEPGEKLREDWPIQGTTGYDFLNVLTGLYVDRRAEEPLTRFYREFTGRDTAWDDAAFEKKNEVLRDVLGSDVIRLSALLREICEKNRDHRDYTQHEIRHAVRTLVACYPIYRTYVVAGEAAVEDDIRCIEHAVESAKRARADLDADLFDFLRDILLLRVKGEAENSFAAQFQQFTGPAMAKGVEDTAFYSFNRFAALNEVGGDPGRFGVTTAEFHDFNLMRQLAWPETQLASTTHDTKRSEDVRARLAVLSEIPGEWRAAVERWASHNERHKSAALPDRNTEYLLYQTMVGAWPIAHDRLNAYMLKAVREAKENTRWTEPNEDYENALRHFIERLLSDVDFIGEMEAFVRPLIRAGRVNSLAQTLIRLTAPGVPDIYQGTELWDLSLVDPDNRRPVDYDRRRQLLGELDGLSVERIVERMEDGLPKLWTIREALRVRRERPFGGYTPLAASGRFAEHLVAYRRGDDVIAVAPRLSLSVGNWEDTAVELPAGEWRNVLARGAVAEARVARLFAQFPVALLTKGSPA